MRTHVRVQSDENGANAEHISSCECNKVVSAFLLFCRRGDFVFQTVFSDCWKFKRKEKLNRNKLLLFLYYINDLLYINTYTYTSYLHLISLITHLLISIST